MTLNAIIYIQWHSMSKINFVFHLANLILTRHLTSRHVANLILTRTHAQGISSGAQLAKLVLFFQDPSSHMGISSGEFNLNQASGELNLYQDPVHEMYMGIFLWRLSRDLFFQATGRTTTCTVFPGFWPYNNVYCFSRHLLMQASDNAGIWRI